MCIMTLSRLQALLLAALLLCSFPVEAETISEFTRNDQTYTELTLNLDDGEIDSRTKFVLPNAEVNSAMLSITGEADANGSYARDVGLRVRDAEWNFNGTGYGALGMQDRFATGGPNSYSYFKGSSSDTVELLLPADATITDATIDITGRPYGSGELEEHRLGSVDSNGGSSSYDPEVVTSGGKHYLIWMDSGDLEDMDPNWDNIIFRRYDGGWDDPVLLEGQRDTTFRDYPNLARDDSNVYAAWRYSSREIHFTSSSDDGVTWEPVSIPDFDCGTIIDFDMAANGGSVYLAWVDNIDNGSGTDYDVWVAWSGDDGETWSIPRLVSDNSDQTSDDARVAVSGNNVHVTWREYRVEGDDRYYSTEYRRSTNGGTSFDSQQKLSDGINTIIEPTITADTSSRVIVAWEDTDSDTLDNDIKARASSNNGGTFGTEQTLSDSSDNDVIWAEVATDGSGNVYTSWRRYLGITDQPYKIVMAKSTNGGGSWGTPTEIDTNADSDFRASPFVSADGSSVVVAWSDRDDTTGASSDQDILLRVSTNGGDSWGTPLGASDQYYEADSQAPAMATSGDWLYLIYRDGGDLDPAGDTNGCDAHNDDGDIYFRRSNDNGETWSSSVVLSNYDADGDINPNNYYYRTALAAAGSYVYAAWIDYGLADGDLTNDYDIIMSISGDYGVSWGEPFVFTDDSDDGSSTYAPVMVADGSSVYIAWWDNGNHDGSGTDYDIIFRYSDDYGQSWSDFIVPVDNTYSDYYPALAVGGGRIHVAWYVYTSESGNYRYEIQYTYSEDGGATWSSYQRINPESTSSNAYYPSIASDGEVVYLTWRDYGDYDSDGFSDYDAVLKLSLDNGDTWEAAQLISDDAQTTSSSYLFPAVVTGNGLAYVAWQEYRISGRVNDTWLYDTSNEAWTAQEPDPTPPELYMHRLAYAANVQRTVLFGGYSDTDIYSTETWLYDAAGDSWTKGSSDTTGRRDHAMAYDPGEGKVVVFGGQTSGDSYNDETWVYDPIADDWTELSPSTRPNGRYGASMVYDAASDRIVLFGGYGQNDVGSYTYLNDTWLFELDGGTGTWTELTTTDTAPGRNDHRIVSDGSEVMIFGGYGSTGYLGDTWTLDVSAATWVEQNPTRSPAARYDYGMAYDTSLSRTVLFGGRASGSLYDTETWHYDFATGEWDLIEPTGSPPGRYSHDMTYDSNQGRAVLYGGYRDTSYDHFFRFSADGGASWSSWRDISDAAGSAGTLNYVPPAVAMGDRAYFAYTDGGNIDGGGSDDTDIYVRATLGEDYPDNPSLNIDGGGSDWQWSGELNTRETWDNQDAHSTQSLADALTNALASADTTTDLYGNEMATLEIRVASDTKGVVWLDELSILYDFEFIFSGQYLVDEINEAWGNADPEDETYSVNLFTSAGGAGRVNLDNLAIVTKDADLSLEEVTYNPNPPKEGNDLVVTATVSNDGDGDANVRVAFWHDSVSPANEFGNLSAEVEGHDSVELTATWFGDDDMTVGSHRLIVAIVDSVPNDGSEGNDVFDEYINVVEADPEIQLEEFELGGMAVEDTEVEIFVNLSNDDGERYGKVDIFVYEEDEGGAEIMRELGLQIDVGDTKSRSATWTASNIDELLLLVIDNETEDEIIRQTLDPEVLSLVNFVVTGVEVLDENDDPLTSISDMTTAYFEVTIENQGSFDVRTHIELTLKKGAKTIVLDQNYFSSQLFNAGESRTFPSSGGSIEATFRESDVGSDIYGNWKLEVKIFHIVAEVPEQQVWDPDEKEFIDDSFEVVVLDPPQLSIDDFDTSTNDPETGDTVVFTVSVNNDGGATASGIVKLYHGDATSLDEMRSKPFTVPGYDSVNVEINWTVPANIKGEYIVTARLYDIYPPEPEYSEEDNYITYDQMSIRGSITSNPDTGEGSDFPLVPVAGAIVFLMVALGAVWFLMQRSQGPSDSALDEEEMAPVGGIQTPPAMPPAAPPAYPPAAGVGAATAGAAAMPPPTPPPAAPPAAAAGAVTIKCPKCATMLKIADTRRPLTVACPSCSTQLKLEQ